MRAAVTPEAESAIADIAQRHSLSQDAVFAMLVAVNNGGGTMAQFSIPELGGSGQWMRGGMTMVGNMFDNGLKARVDGLCRELSQLLATTTVFPPMATADQRGFTSNNWWPADLGSPSSSGAQNNARYAIFPNARRLAVQTGGVTRVYDTGEHRIGGVQQQQGGASGSVNFTSQFGTFDVSSLSEIGSPPQPQSRTQPQAPPTQPQAPPTQPTQSPPVPAQRPLAGISDADAIVAAIESLAGLHQRGILSDDEFSTKKAELLGRL
ncbi:putative oligomerization/nucleic acid binding protein [Williamsia limnetica]|uniref:Putative oligomerization/nucleic acid binding protein n=1 Tax=Williamsia limnetica TaxID=882452 RepID=A0A318RS98_WILLI|nr:SHOCT domain-containing protein [Williamsia limnetica]PYE18653.1 putative oligomerization/nucleic acid binding protein [Williamsia limnetica]